MRYELKFIFQQGDQGKIIQKLFSSPYIIREIHEKRQINNIYFDTLNYSDYLSATNGAEFRKKYRIRWYGELDQLVSDPQLELKFKRGWEGGKDSFLLPSFTLDSLNMRDYFRQLQDSFGSYTPEHQQMLGELFSRNPVLINSYQRSYYQTADEKFRFTLDETMRFYDYFSCTSGKNTNFVSEDPKVLLELKFDSELTAEGTQLVDRLGLRISKNSKYVNGVDSVFFHKHPMPF